MSSLAWIPLLSPQPLESYSPENFREYVRSLYHKKTARVKRGASAKVKKRPGVTARLNKKGTLVISTKRKDPKYLTQEELLEIETKTGRPANEVFLKTKQKGFTVMTHAEADEIRVSLGELPW